MRYETIKDLSEEDFRRLTGVKPGTFKAMLEILELAGQKKHTAGGVRSKLALEERLLMALEYWREYRTYFHIAHSFGTSESSCWKTVRWIEQTLIQSQQFRLPGKKTLLKNDTEFDVVLVDATETACERPQKNKSATTLARKNGTH